MNLKHLLFTVLCLSPIFTSNSQAETIEINNTTNIPTNLLVEGKGLPLNVHNMNPRLSWHSNAEVQNAYQIQVASTTELLDKNEANLWDSGKVIDGRSVNIPYQGKPLHAGKKAAWRVRVWPKGSETPQQWSYIGHWEMGLIHQSDWQANWIQVKETSVASNNANHMEWILRATDIHPENKSNLSADKLEKQHRTTELVKSQPTASLFRHDFSTNVDKQVVNAKLYSTAAGYYEVFLNGRKVKDRLMDPGQTDYDQRILYNSDEVSDLLLSGDNVIAVHLGSGWYDENIAFSQWSSPDLREGEIKPETLSYGQPKFIAQLELTYEDGSKQLVASNNTWLSHPSPVLKEGLFSGELYDANEEVPNWHQKMNADELTNWQPVEELQQWPTKKLEPQLLPPIRAIKKLKPQKIIQPREGVWVLDFGQNFTAVPTINLAKLNLKPNQTINLRYAEWADVDGNISQRSGGGAPSLHQVDTYIASGRDQDTWTPAFAWHGFRFVEITGLTQEPELDVMWAHLVRSDVNVAGYFNTSNTLVNKIHDLALWSYESNLMSVPLDCPIRERAGWTGDAHAALITGNYNFNMQNLWEKYLGDFQTSAYIAPAVVPGKRTWGESYDWAVAEVIIAWEHYRHNGDVQILLNQYPSMKKYMAAGEDKLENNLLRMGFGDWCDPVLEPGMDRKRCNPQHTSPAITSSALFAHSANLMAKIASILNFQDDMTYYSALFKSISEQFHHEFYDVESSHYGSQTADAMALRFDIAPVELRQSVADALNKDVLEKWRGHGSIGALGQTYVYRALSDYGYADTAFGIFTAKDYPGYEWQFEKLHATTLWERKGVYNADKDPRGENAPGRSMNHPFHSGYDGWFYEGLGGIRPLENSPGFQHFELKPVFPQALQSVEVAHTTGYGKIKSSWLRQGSSVKWSFSVPHNTTAKVEVPSIIRKIYGPGTHELTIELGE